jgi:hypothetical protein
MCLVPESWAEAGRYPFHVTLWPLILAVVICAGLVGIGQGRLWMGRLRAFAGVYDARYAPLQISSAGVLSWAGPVKQPINLANDLQTVVVDPTDKTKLDDVKTLYACLVTSKNVQIRYGPIEGVTMPITELAGDELPAAGKTGLINGTNMKEYLDQHEAAYLFTILLLVGGTKILSGGMWCALMIFSIWPLAVIAARTGEGELVIPRRAAVRFAAAVLVPLLMLEGVLEAVGYPVAGTMGVEGAWMFWFVAGGVMSFWAGKMAKGMYGPKVKGKRA